MEDTITLGQAIAYLYYARENGSKPSGLKKQEMDYLDSINARLENLNPDPKHFYRLVEKNNQTDYSDLFISMFLSEAFDNDNLELLKFFNDNADKYIDIKLIESNFVDNHNPATMFNLGVKHAKGEYICITNPEVFHKDDILGGFDKIFDNQPDCYIVCACENVHNFKLFSSSFEEFKYEHYSWYQHTEYRDARYHFCSCLSKENYLKIGGFDERFSQGYAYDDDDFRETVKRNNIEFVVVDKLLTLHQAHESTVKNINIDQLLKRNKCLYFLKKQNKSDKEIEDFLNSL